MCRKLICLVSLMLMFCMVGSVMAAHDWLGGPGDWHDQTKWSGNVVPVMGDSTPVWISPGDSDVSITGAASAFELFADGGNLALNGGSLTTQWKLIATANGASVNVNSGTVSLGNSLFVGDWGEAYVNVYDGLVSIGDSIIAGAAGSANGTINISGGTVAATWNCYLGDSGAGTMNVSGGIVSADAFIVGQWGTSSGNLNISGGSVITPGWLVLGNNGGTGTVNLTGGTLEAGNLNIVNSPASSFDIAGGTLNLQGNITSLPGVTGYGIPGNLQFAYNAGTDFTSITAIPEPMTLLLLGLGGLCLLRKKRSC